MTRFRLLFACCLLLFHGMAQRHIDLFSPDHQIHFRFELRNHKPGYSVSYQHLPLLNFSALDFRFPEGPLGGVEPAGKEISKSQTADYSLVVGKTKHVHDSLRWTMIPLRQINAPHRLISLEVSVFNDGIAFRYWFPPGYHQPLIINGEYSHFNIAGNPVAHALFLPDYTSSHEGMYTRDEFKDLPRDSLMDMPMLLEYPHHQYMAITEAALLDYAGMYLTKSGNELVSTLSPHPDDTTIKVSALLPHATPWRVCLIGDRIGTLIESNILTSLAPPLRIKDTSWIKPGKTTFPWWNGNVTPDTLNAPGNNFVTQQYYIDFCARNHIEYHSVVEYGLHQWYTDDGVSFAPGPHPDVTTPVPGLDMKQVCDYAHSKGVGIRVWVHWRALYPKLDTAFKVFEQWGISGMMVDFLDRDDQQMVNIQTEILEKAAAHHLHIQFHGAYKPTGLNRTYPNEFTREGALNYEHDKWNPEGVKPDHDLDIAFTRALAGATDYHLGGFRAVAPKDFRAQYTRPLMLGTRCHMLGMYVVLENANSMVCDYPAAYEGQPGFEFIQQVPTRWDATKVIAAEPFQYLVIARQHGSDWFAGGINEEKPHTVQLPLQFLPEGSYLATSYQDSVGASDPNLLIRTTRMVTRADQLTIPMAAGGGIAIRFTKQ